MVQFRALYMAALAVVCTGVSGVVILPKAHAQLQAQQTVVNDVRVQAGKYVWNTTSQLKVHLGQMFSHSARNTRISF